MVNRGPFWTRSLQLRSFSWFILRTAGVEIILRERSNSVIDWENYTEIRGLRKERGRIRFECGSLFNASIACFARLPRRVHAYAIPVARTRFPKGQGIFYPRRIRARLYQWNVSKWSNNGAIANGHCLPFSMLRYAANAASLREEYVR